MNHLVFVALEATLEGIPVLVSNNVGAKDILSKENIFEDNSALMIKLEELLSDGLTKLREKHTETYINVCDG